MSGNCNYTAFENSILLGEVWIRAPNSGHFKHNLQYAESLFACLLPHN